MSKRAPQKHASAKTPARAKPASPPQPPERGWRRMLKTTCAGSDAVTSARWLDAILREERPEFHAETAVLRQELFDEISVLLKDPEAHARVLVFADACLREIFVQPRIHADYDACIAIRKTHEEEFADLEKSLAAFQLLRVAQRVTKLREALDAHTRAIRDLVQNQIFGRPEPPPHVSATHILDLMNTEPGRLASLHRENRLDELSWADEQQIVLSNVRRNAGPGHRPYGRLRDHAEVAARILEDALKATGREKARYLAAKLAARLLEAYVPEEFRGELTVKKMIDKLYYETNKRDADARRRIVRRK